MNEFPSHAPYVLVGGLVIHHAPYIRGTSLRTGGDTAARHLQPANQTGPSKGTLAQTRSWGQASQVRVLSVQFPRVPDGGKASSARISSFKVGVWMAANEVSQGPVLANQHSTPTGQTRKEESTECRPAAHKKAKENGGGAKRGKSSPCRDCVRITEVGSGVPLLFPLFHSNKRNRIRVYRKAVKERRRTP